MYAKIQAEPEDINHYKQIADYYHKLKGLWQRHRMDFVCSYAAYWCCRYTTLEAYESELYVEQLESYIEYQEDVVAQDPTNEQASADLLAYQQQLNEYKMEQAKTRVEKYPNDYNYRFELGMLLFESGDIDGSIQQFQLSQRSPKVRTKSLLYLR